MAPEPLWREVLLQEPLPEGREDHGHIPEPCPFSARRGEGAVERLKEKLPTGEVKGYFASCILRAMLRQHGC
jgi:hypothetical protein